MLNFSFKIIFLISLTIFPYGMDSLLTESALYWRFYPIDSNQFKTSFPYRLVSQRKHICLAICSRETICNLLKFDYQTCRFYENMIAKKEKNSIFYQKVNLESTTTSIQQDTNTFELNNNIRIKNVKKPKESYNPNRKPFLTEEFDLIGPPDKISNLRPVKSFIPENESIIEKEYRLLKDKIFEFNQQYWTQQNLKFIQSRKKYIENYRIEQKLNNRNNDIDVQDPDTNQMNEFYKKFLNENYHNHYEYNRQWFKYNISLLWPATRVFLYRLRRKIID
ncbi:unnamed protein product [Brachionus calyciflorus]|uniref:Uncharacterized protein n=1 Tax=Brachionus calyciflorus TaxID=104777 RepID=A0A813RC50_9BILA|nr:unnamed protein product [Brachionus calyciflorus]